MTPLANDIYDFCPDTIEQGFDAFPDLLGEENILGAENMFSPESLEHMRLLAEGIDFEQPDYGMQLLKKALQVDKAVGLWWD